jgi:hypothetical protein
MSKLAKLSCAVSPQVAEAVECLLWQGLHGSTRSEVVRRLIEQAVELQIVRGHLRHDQLNEDKRASAVGAP